MHSVDGFMFSLDGKNGGLLEHGSLADYKIDLGEGREWTIAIDQSTTCTGIALIAADGSYGVMADVQRDPLLPASDFKKCLTKFMRRLVEGQKINTLIMERPIPHEKFKTSRDKLHELKGLVESWQESIYAFENTKFHDILPNSWRANVVDKRKGKGRSNDKLAIAYDVADHYPITNYYLQRCPAKDYDSFEALGIYIGFQKYAYDELGRPMIYGTEEKNHISFVGYAILPTNHVNEYVELILQKLVHLGSNFTHRVYNPKYNLHKNIRMASSGWPNGLVFEVPRNKLEQFRWSHGVDPSDYSQTLVAFVYKKRLLSHGDVRLLEGFFDWTEDVESV